MVPDVRDVRMKHLGPISAGMLAPAGIETAAELGAVDTFPQVSCAGLRSSLNLLYALKGALTGQHWSHIINLTPVAWSFLMPDVG